MLIERRSFLIGAGVLFCAPAIVRAENLMKIHDPLVRGVQFQTWPFGQDRPGSPWIAGSIKDEYNMATLHSENIGSWNFRAFPKVLELTHGRDRLSTFMDTIHEYERNWNVYWKEIW